MPETVSITISADPTSYTSQLTAALYGWYACDDYIPAHPPAGRWLRANDPEILAVHRA